MKILFTFLLIFLHFNVSAYVRSGEWYSGANNLSFTSIEQACLSYVDYNNALSDRYVWGFYNYTNSSDPGKWNCNLTRDGEIQTNAPLVELELIGWGKGASAVRYSHEAHDLRYDVMPFWVWGSKIKATNPKEVCDFIVNFNNSSTTYKYSYSHMEVYHIQRYSFTPSWFQCIATKQRVQTNSSLPAHPIGYTFLATIKTDGLQENAGSGSVDAPCIDSAFCSGDLNPTDPDNPVQPDKPPIFSDLDLSLVENKLDAIDSTLHESNINAINTQTEIINLGTDVIRLNTKLTELTTKSIEGNSFLSDISDLSAQSKILLEEINNDNSDLLKTLNDINVSSKSDFSNLLFAINSSDATNESKLEAVRITLKSLQESNDSGFSLLAKSLDNITVDVDDSSTVSAINNLDASFNVNSRVLREQISAGDNNLITELRSLKASENQNSSNIIDAINSIDISSPPTSSNPVDLTSIEENLLAIKANTDVLNSPPDSFIADPDLDLKSYWNSSYSGGFEGIWEEKQQLFKQTAFYKWVESFSLQISGDAEIPTWNLCFDVGLIDLGCHELVIDSRIWAAIRVFLMLTAFAACRYMLVGG